HPRQRWRDEGGADGVSGSRPRTVACRALSRHRRAGPATARSRCGGRNDYHFARDPDRDSRYSQSRLGYPWGRRIMRGSGKVLVCMCAICLRTGRFLVVALIIASLCTVVNAQQPSFTWEQIRDKFLATNPTLRAQEQSIESSRASEVTAGLRPNPQFQNDTTS